MTNILNFHGFIRGVTYKAYLVNELKQYELNNFNINTCASYGLIKTDDSEIAYSKWVSPKRTRSYPFARIYNTYNAPKSLTVIPVIKDEGLDGDLDKIQYSTISWMNLLNVYIVLGYYESATKNQSKMQNAKQKITSQRFNNEFIKSQISEIIQYKQSALHWNKNLFEERFTKIFDIALKSYESIADQTGVQVHSQDTMRKYLDKIMNDFEQFKNISLESSRQASNREVNTVHQLEHLEDGLKGTFYIQNYLGGIYYLTADELIFQDHKLIIQESKNSSKNSLADISDIQDGLFKLIIYSNLSSLQLDGKELDFSSKLKLTGKGVIGSIKFPSTEQELAYFFKINYNQFNKKQKSIINKLKLEAAHHKNLEIEIKGNL